MKVSEPLGFFHPTAIRLLGVYQGSYSRGGAAENPFTPSVPYSVARRTNPWHRATIKGSGSHSSFMDLMPILDGYLENKAQERAWAMGRNILGVISESVFSNDHRNRVRRLRIG